LLTSLDGDDLNTYLQQDGVACEADHDEKPIGEQAWQALYAQCPEACNTTLT